LPHETELVKVCAELPLILEAARNPGGINHCSAVVSLRLGTGKHVKYTVILFPYFGVPEVIRESFRRPCHDWGRVFPHSEVFIQRCLELVRNHPAGFCHMRPAISNIDCVVNYKSGACEGSVTVIYRIRTEFDTAVIKDGQILRCHVIPVSDTALSI